MGADLDVLRATGKRMCGTAAWRAGAGGFA
jgi:hypothetical protein